jgi:uncharacterized protein (DUF1778 family)
VTTSMAKASKAERIEIRVTPHVKALLSAAAASKHTTISEFLLANGIDAAEKEITTARVFYASENGWAAIQKMLDEDNAPSAATILWLTKKE